MVSAEPAEQGSFLFWGHRPCRRACFSPLGELLECKRFGCLGEERPCCLDMWSLAHHVLQLKATRPTNKSSKWCLARQGPTSTTEKDDSRQTLYTHAGPVLSTHKSPRELQIMTPNVGPRLPCSRPRSLTPMWITQSWHAASNRERTQS